MSDSPTYPPHIHTVILPSGPMRKLFVDRTSARRLEPPITVEDVETGIRHYAVNVRWSDPQHIAETEFKWSGNNVDAPALWIETDAELELTLR